MQIAFDGEVNNSAQKFPISFMSSGLIVTHISISDTSYPFIVDTGASVCVVGNELKDRLFDSWIDENSGLFSSGRFSVFGKEFSNIVFLNQNIDDIKKDESVYGIIGSNCMLDSTIAIDCPNKTIQIY